MSDHPTRRGFLRTAPVAAALVAAPAAVLAVGSRNADAPLAALADEYNALQEPTYAAEMAGRQATDDWEAKQKLRGVKNPRWWETNEPSVTTTLSRAERAWETLNAKELDILAIQPAGLAGLAAWAAPLRSHRRDIWEEPFDDLDWDKKLIRMLVERIEALAEQEDPA